MKSLSDDSYWAYFIHNVLRQSLNTQCETDVSCPVENTMKKKITCVSCFSNKVGRWPEKAKQRVSAQAKLE